MTNKEIKEIQAWIEYCIKENKLNFADDIHLDEINPKYSNKKYWLNISLKVLNEAMTFIETKYDFISPLILIQLNADENIKMGINFTSYFGASQELSWEPPSLMLFDIRSIDYTNTISLRKEIERIKYDKYLFVVLFYEMYNKNAKQFIRNLILYPEKI